MKLEVAVKALIQNDEGKYLLLQRTSPLVDGSGIRWDIPGGRINSDEKLLDALAREIHEETGLIMTEPLQLLKAQDMLISDKDWHVVRLTYLVQLSGTVKLSSEHQAYQWATLAEATNLDVDDYVRELLSTLVP